MDDCLMACLIQVATLYDHGRPVNSNVCCDPVPKVEGFTSAEMAAKMISQIKFLVNQRAEQTDSDQTGQEVRLTHIVLLGE